MLDLLSPLLYALAALGLGVLCLPIALSLQFRRDGLPVAWKLLVQMAFFRGGIGFGLHLDAENRSLMPVLLGKTIPFPTLSLNPKPGQKKTVAKQTEQTAKPKDKTVEQSATQDLLATIRLVLKPGLKLLASMPHIIGLKSLQIKGNLGFNDPAQTGSINGYIQALKYFKNNKIRIDITPDFTRPGAFGQLELTAHFHLGLLLLLLGRFGLQVASRFLAVRLWGWQPGLI